MTETDLRHVVIFGGGIAAWLTALTMRRWRPHAEIVVVETPSPRELGIGETVGPGFRDLVVRLGIDADRFDRNCSCRMRLATRFDAWGVGADPLWWPFAWPGHRRVELFARLMQAPPGDRLRPFADLSPHVLLARRQGTPTTEARAALAHGLHFDTGAFVQLARDTAAARQVRQLFGTIRSVRLSADGAIASVEIGADRILGADLFVDATGGALIKDLPQRAWRAFPQIACDRAVGLWLPGDDDAPYASIVEAAPQGYFWQAPLAHSIGFGLAYKGDDLDDAQAVEALVSAAPLARRRTADPRRITYTPGRRDMAWGGNGLAIGHAAACVDPIFASECHFVQRSLETFLDLSEVHPDLAGLREAFNGRVAADVDAACDIVQFLLCAGRRGEPFWTAVRAHRLSDRLASRVASVRARGTIDVEGDGAFGWTGYAHLLAGTREATATASVAEGRTELAKALDDAADVVQRQVELWQGLDAHEHT